MFLNISFIFVILLNILKSINSYTLNSAKNKQDLIDIIKTLNNDNDGRTDEIKNYNNKLGYEESRELPDEEKEKKLQHMLWLLKKNISAQKQYEELMKAPINSGSRMYFIKNPEVLEEYKNYVRRKKNFPSNYDVSDRHRKEDVKEILKKLQRRAELTASSDQSENFDRQDSQEIGKDESIETTFKPNSFEDKQNTELLDETSEKVNTEANPEQSNKKIDSFESHNKRAQDVTDDIVRREKIDWAETKDELNPKRNNEKMSKSRKDKHKIGIDKKERLFDDHNRDSYIPFKQKPRISYRKPKSDGKKDFFSYGRTSIPFIGKKGIYEDK